MPKAGEAIKELQRTFSNLALLDGSAVACLEGWCLVWPSGVRDPRPIVAACREGGRPTVASLQAGLVLERPPRLVRPYLLGRWQRDLVRLEESGRSLRQWRTSPRHFRRFAEPDRAWLAGRRERVESLGRPREASADRVDGFPEWFGGILQTVAALRGESARSDLLGLARVALATVLESGVSGRRVARPNPVHAERVAAAAALCGLLFEPSVATPHVARALPALAERVASLVLVAPVSVTLAQAAVLHEHRRTDARALRAVEQWLGEGLPWSFIEEVALRQGRWYSVAEIEVPAARRSFCQWHVDVLPRLEAIGAHVELPSELFVALPEGATGDLAALGAFLAQRSPGGRRSPSEELALLDGALGVVRRDPGRLAGVLEVLSAVHNGAGRAAFPEFGAWLNDDVSLDRFVHLSQLCGREPRLSANLLRDFTREERLDGELRHLQALPQRSNSQELRLRRLLAETADRPPPSPYWTRRRLRERVEDLFGEAYTRVVDEVLMEVARDAWDVAVPRMTPPWRDALRLLLGFEMAENQEALRELLRRAAARPGASILREGEANRRWIAAAAGHIDVEAWLAPHATVVAIGGERYRLALEDDPLEVLRMGVPFDTCLSLERGSSMEFTGLNALDANKRVLYLRDEQGQVVARKLLAVSEDWTLLGYRLYISLDARADAIHAAVEAFCRSLMGRTGLTASTVGRPAELHEGDWYDDGPVSFVREDLVAAFCRSLGRPVPERVPASLGREAGGVEGDAATSQELKLWCSWEGAPDPAAARSMIRSLESGRDVVEALPYNLPRHLRVTPLRGLFGLVTRLDRAWARVEAVLPDKRLAQFQLWLRASARSAFVRDPDHRAVIEVLRSGRYGRMARCIALHVAARFSFPRELGRRCVPMSSLDVLEQAPIGCPSAVVAVRALVRDCPGLAADRDVQRALLRQHPPVRLPPDVDLAGAGGEAPPHEWLGDLLLHVPRIGELLAPWQVQDGRSDREQGYWLAVWRQRKPGGTFERCRGVQDASLKADLADLANVGNASGRGGTQVDPVLVREALRVVASWVGGRQDDAVAAPIETLAAALTFLWRFDSTCFLDEEEKWDVARAVAVAVLGLPEEVVDVLTEVVEPWVETAAKNIDHLDHGADALLSTWEFGLARSVVAHAVADYINLGDLRQLRECAEASNRGDLFDEMICDAAPSWAPRRDHDLPSMSAVFDAFMRRRDDGSLLAIYRHRLKTWVQVSTFLDRMIATGVAARPGIRHAAEASSWSETRDDEVRRAWLLDAIDHASTTGASSGAG
jgi:hypothetical protein